MNSTSQKKYHIFADLKILNPRIRNESECSSTNLSLRTFPYKSHIPTRVPHVWVLFYYVLVMVVARVESSKIVRKNTKIPGKRKTWFWGRGKRIRRFVCARGLNGGSSPIHIFLVSIWVQKPSKGHWVQSYSGEMTNDNHRPPQKKEEHSKNLVTKISTSGSTGNSLGQYRQKIKMRNEWQRSLQKYHETTIFCIEKFYTRRNYCHENHGKW